jgi:hypothetical protein
MTVVVARRSRERGLRSTICFLYKKWLAERDAAAAQEHTTETNFASDANGSKRFPSFKDWIAEHKSQSSGAS